MGFLQRGDDDMRILLQKKFIKVNRNYDNSQENYVRVKRGMEVILGNEKFFVLEWDLNF